MSGIRSKNHELITYTSNKKSISCFDDKRYILSDGINTLPYGHKDILKSIKKIFFLNVLDCLDMIERKNNKRLHISVTDIENEKLKEKLKNI